MASAASIQAMFPLKTVNEVRNLFAIQCDNNEPDLVLLSIVAGYIENSMSKVNEVNLTSELTATIEESADNSIRNGLSLRKEIKNALLWRIGDFLYLY